MKYKKLIPVIFIVSAVLLALLIIRIISNNESRIKDHEILADEIKAVHKRIGPLNVTVDPRIELLSSIQVQSDYSILTALNFDYKQDVSDYFKDFSGHKAVKQFSKLANKGFNYDAPPAAMLYLTNPPQLMQKQDFSTYLTDRALGKKQLNAFISTLTAFCTDSSFADFYNMNISFYQEMVDEVYEDIIDLEIVDALDDYYGMEVNSYNLILAPMFHSGGFGPRIVGENGLLDIYGILGPDEVTTREDGTTVPNYSSDAISYLAWHEFSHSFVNPLTEKNSDTINIYSKLFDKINNAMTAQAYGNWETCVNEHIVRAVTTRLAYIYKGEEAGNQALYKELGQSFYYIEPLCKSLEYYEQNRDIYPSFESYYPTLINVFKELSELDLPDSFYQIDFKGPINSAYANIDSLDLVLIIPTNEANEEEQDYLVKYVEAIRDQFYIDTQLTKDTDALEMDLSNSIVIAYGTMEGNLWLSEHMSSFPFKIYEDRIVADKIYEGTDLSYITAMPNPDNYKNPAIIYTGQNATSIININSVFHGPTDYVVIENFEEIYSGYYQKKGEDWTFR